jgi:hypothetical protein
MNEDLPHHGDTNTFPITGPQIDAENLKATDWNDIVKRLLGYARYRLSRHGTAGNRFCNKPDDYVQEAVKLYLDGVRRFSPTPETTLFAFLCGVVDSLISHDAEKTERRGYQIALSSDDPDDAGFDFLETRLASPENFEENIVLQNEYERFLKLLDPDLREYVRLRVDEEAMPTAEEFAATLRTSVSEIRNMDRRLRRRRNQWNQL